MWLEIGYENTKFYHQNANYRKSINNIWGVENDGGEILRSFKYFVTLGVKHFENICLEIEGENIVEIVKVASCVPKLV
jgi:hypothetical protein